MQFKLVIPRWRPALVNELRGHHMHAARLKKIDANMVAGYVALNRIPKAAGRRRVDLTLVLTTGREPDEDAVWKSLKDALKLCGMLIDDGRRWCEQGNVIFDRGKERATVIQLTDLEGEQA